jgi:hypothetical protein
MPGELRVIQQSLVSLSRLRILVVEKLPSLVVAWVVTNP